MPWYNNDYPPSYKNQPIQIRDKAIEIANALLKEGTPEGTAIAIGLKLAREHFANFKLLIKNQSEAGGSSCIVISHKL